MRPRHKAAENAFFQRGASSYRIRFNEAAA